jgi:peptidoglycan/xylan/chitin deacetylase (PgdA/CDA1 family)
MLKRIVDEGHVIGNHSFAHPLGRQFGLVRYRHDVEECQAIVERWAGCRPALFRPPLGHLSFASLIAPRLVGLSPLLWSVDSDDWELRASSDVPVAAARLLQKLSGRPLHDIVLFHDEKRLTAELLQSILPVLASRSVDLRPSIGQIG